jgi:hypothetical protein
MKLPALLTLALAGAAPAAVISTINSNNRTISAQTTTTGNYLSITDLQNAITAANDLTKAGVLTGEESDGSSATTLAAELTAASAEYTIAGANRYSRNDATAVAESPHLGATSGIVVGTNPGAAARGRVNLIDSSQTLTLGSTVPGQGVGMFGAMFYNYLTAGTASLVRVTATFSDSTTAVYDAANGFTMAGALQFTFVGFQAPAGEFITSIKIDEVAGGGWLVSDDFALVVVPEPSVALLGGIGLLALLRRRR